jgi:hypothetical protein
MGKQLYNTTNTTGTVMAYKRGTAQLSDKTLKENIGTCGALSALFLKNMMAMPPELTNPDQDRAAVLFAGCWIRHCDPVTKVLAGAADVHSFNTHIMELADLTPLHALGHNTYLEALKYIAVNAGYYYFDLLQGHILAAVNRNARWYFFDSDNWGLWEHRTANGFVLETISHLKGEGWAGTHPAWTYSVT